MAFSPGTYRSTNGVGCKASDKEMPGTLTICAKNCILGNLEKFN
jgi:hypothetical protein